MNTLSTITLLDHDIDIHSGPIGISFSGGADSAVLAYILLLNAPGHINFYVTNSLVWPNRTSGAIQLYEKLISFTNRDNTSLVITDIEDEQNRENLFTTPINDIMNGDINLVYTGITKNPPANALNTDFSGMSIRDHSTAKPLYNGTNNRFYTPFVNIDKRYVAKLYKYYDIIESILPHTCSCVQTKSNDHCGECWWCKEREWAFKKIS